MVLGRASLPQIIIIEKEYLKCETYLQHSLGWICPCALNTDKLHWSEAAELYLPLSLLHSPPHSPTLLT